MKRRLLVRLLPFMAWLPAVSPRSLRADAVAGATVALVAIPQSLAYAQLAGVPPHLGLYAAILPMIVGALWGSSPQLSTGPVAFTSLLTAASLAPLAAVGTEQFIAGAVALAVLAGLFQVAFGVARLGMVLNLLSQPVLTGFVNAAVLVIAFTQLPGLLGIPARQSAQLLADTWYVLSNFALTDKLSLSFGVAAFLMLAAFRRFAPRAPGILVTVAALTTASWGLGYAAQGGNVVGAMPRHLPGLALPRIEWSVAVQLLPAAFVIALVGFMETMSSCKVAAVNLRRQWDENQELVGQGLAKIAAALNGAFPVSGSFSRSALNLAAGARTGLASVVTAAITAITAVFLGALLFHLPKPVLAAIIVLAVLSLIEHRSVRLAWRASRDDAAAGVLTFVATLAFAPNIQNGIFVGIIVSLALSLYRRMRPRAIEVSLHADGTLRDRARWGLPPLDERIGALRFDDSLVFVNCAHFEEMVLRLERERPGLRYLLVAASGINEIDASGIAVVWTLADSLGAKGITLVFSGVKKQVQDIFDRTGLTTRLGVANIYPTDRLAIEALRRSVAAAAPQSLSAVP